MQSVIGLVLNTTVTVSFFVTWTGTRIALNNIRLLILVCPLL
jgi:hypothetical protein